VATIASRNSAGSAAIAAKTSRTSAATAGSAGAGARVRQTECLGFDARRAGASRGGPALGHVGVAQHLQEVADVVIATHQAGARQDAGVGLLNEVLVGIALVCAGDRTAESLRSSAPTRC
jgi:hypothetical protein